MKRLIYIDESGDPGLTKDTSRYFVMAAVVIDVEENFNLEKKMQDIRRSYGWPPEREFKFNRTRKSIIREVLSGINGLKYSIYIAILDKNKMLNDGKMSKMEIYKNLLVELLSKVDRNDAKILLDGSGGKKYEKNLLTRLRKELGDISKKNFRLTDSIKSDGIQLADLVAGSVNGALLKRKDATSCMRLIQKRIKTTPEHH